MYIRRPVVFKMRIHGSKPKVCWRVSGFGDEIVFVEEGIVKIRMCVGGWGSANRTSAVLLVLYVCFGLGS